MTRRRVGPLTLAALLLVTGLAHAEEPPDAGDAPRAWLAQRGSGASISAPAAPPGGPGLRFVAGALLVAGTAAAAWLFARKRPRAAATLAGPRVEVLSSARIGPKAQAVVARVGSRVLLLGVTDGSVQRLAWLPSKDFAPRPSPAAAPRETAPVSDPAPPERKGPGFGDVLRDALGLRTPRAMDPALMLAAATRDVYTPARPAAPAERTPTPDTVDVERQARGLVARLKELGP